jgi:hypothetical protein
MITNAYINELYINKNKLPPTAYCIVVLTPDDRDIKYGSLFGEKEISLTHAHRYCSLFSKKRASFKTQQQAIDFLKTVKQKDHYKYGIGKATV